MANLTTIALTKSRKQMIDKIKSHGFTHIDNTFIYDLGLASLLKMCERTVPTDTFAEAYLECITPQQ